MDKNQIFYVSEIIKNIGNTILMPRLKNKCKNETEEKHNDGSYNSSVDYDCQIALISALKKTDKNTIVVAPENICALDDLNNAVSDKKNIWIINPLDGKNNFADSKEIFAVAVSHLTEGKTDASWIYLPAKQQMLCGNINDGVFLNEEPVVIKPAHTNIIEVNDEHIASASPDFTIKKSASYSYSYFSVVCGQTNGIIFDEKLLPWNHTAGTFLHQRAGGYNAYINGDNYKPENRDRITLVAASSRLEYKKLCNYAKKWENERKRNSLHSMAQSYILSDFAKEKDAFEKKYDAEMNVKKENKTSKFSMLAKRRKNQE